MRLIQWGKLLLLRTGQLAGISGIEAEISIFYRLPQCLVQDTVNILDRLWGKPRRLRFAGLAKVIIKLLDFVCGQRLQPHSAEGGENV